MNIFDDYDAFLDRTFDMDEEEEHVARREYAEKLEKLIEEDPGNGKLHHYVGLCLYMSPGEWGDSDKSRIEIALNRSLLLDPSCCDSLLLLGYFYFDTGKYRLSLNCMDAFLDHPLKNRVDESRHKKIDSLRIASQIYLDLLETANLKSALEKLLADYNAMNWDDRGSADPHELVKALENSRHAQCPEIEGFIETIDKISELREGEDCATGMTEKELVDKIDGFLSGQDISKVRALAIQFALEDAFSGDKDIRDLVETLATELRRARERVLQLQASRR